MPVIPMTTTLNIALLNFIVPPNFVSGAGFNKIDLDKRLSYCRLEIGRSYQPAG